MSYRIAIRVCLLAGVLGAQIAAAQDTVTLRPSASVAPGRPVTLGDVAEVNGPQADALRSVVVVPADSFERARLDVGQVRAVLGRSAGINVGRVALSGGTVDLKRGSPVETIAAQRPVPPSLPGLTVRDQLPRAVAEALGVREADVQLRLNESDGALLQTPLSGRICTAVAAGVGDKMPIHVRVYEGDRLIVAQTTRVGVTVRRDVLVPLHPIERGTSIESSMISREERWLPVNDRTASAGQSLGAAAKVALEAGTPIASRQVERAAIVQRGDLVSVDCVSGGVVVRATMRAVEDGREGDVIRLVPPAQSRPKRIVGQEHARRQDGVRARIAGPGRAVAIASEAHTPREAPQ